MDLHKNCILATQLFAETLPISSSTHVWIVDFLWTLFSKSTARRASEPIMDVLFLPTLVILIFYFKSHARHLLSTLAQLIYRPSLHHVRWIFILLRVAGYLLASTLTFAITYYGLRFLFSLEMKYIATPDAWIAQAIGLCATGALLLSTYFTPRQHDAETPLTLSKSIFIGFLQGFAALPGISRLGITLVASRWVQLPPHRAFEFSTLLQITVFLGNLFKNMLFPQHSFSPVIGYTTYLHALTSFSWDNLLVMAIFAAASYQGLRFTKKLNSAKRLWQLSPYFLAPISILVLFH